MPARPSDSGNWGREADVVVVGYGAAGAAAAITAHDAGANVLILEKAPKGKEGGNSRVSAQGWLCPAPVDKAISYFNALCGAYTVPQDISRVWAEEMGKNLDWVKGIGGNPVETSFPGQERGEFPEFPGADCAHVYAIDGKSGNERTWNLLKASVDKRDIQVLYEAPARELLQDSKTKQIIGVRAEREGSVIDIKAGRAVVLTCGGFENNQDMVRQFLTNLPRCYPLGTPYNTGDGIKMAMAVGADLWHMNNIAGPWFCLKVPEFPSAFEILPLHYAREFPGGMILINADGKRFVDEKHRDAHGKMNTGNQWIQTHAPSPMFMIFDHALLSSVPLCDKNNIASWNVIHKVYDWSDDNSAELAKGWIKKASTIAEMAGKIKVDATALEESINNWNSYCTDGKDIEFNRTRMLSPIAGPPFYAVELSPTCLNTQGGPRRNEKGQIIKPNGEPIPRLYSAGEIGSVYSFLYQGGGNIGECLAFGRISGRNAAKEKPWE